MADEKPIEMNIWNLGTDSTPNDPVNDSYPGLLIGISSTVGTVWWLLSWFVFIKNQANNSNLKTIGNQEVLPIGFFWERLSEVDGEFVYLALSMFMTFFAFIIVSVVEFIGWVMYCVGEREFFVWWVRYIGYYGSAALYGMPVVFAII